jgi:hypothetical protein
MMWKEKDVTELGSLRIVQFFSCYGPWNREVGRVGRIRLRRQ